MPGIDQFDFESETKEDKVDVRRIKPEQLKSETPVFVVPGFGATAAAFDHVMKHLGKDGRGSLAVEDPHGLDQQILDEFFEKLRQDRSEAEIEQIRQNYPLVELKKIAAIFKALDQEGISQTDAVGFSQGCLELVYAAEIDPKRFRNLVLVDPAGIVGQHSRATLYKRTAENIIAEKSNISTKKYASYVSDEGFKETMERMQSDPKVMSRVVGSSPKETLLDDTKTIAEADITKKLENLRKQGIKITIIHGVDDRIFPMDKVFDLKNDDGNIRTGPNTHLNKNTADIFLPVKGTHNQVGLYAEKWMEMVKFALDKMENPTVGQKQRLQTNSTKIVAGGNFSKNNHTEMEPDGILGRVRRKLGESFKKAAKAADSKYEAKKEAKNLYDDYRELFELTVRHPTSSRIQRAKEAIDEFNKFLETNHIQAKDIGLWDIEVSRNNMEGELKRAIARAQIAHLMDLFDNGTAINEKIFERISDVGAAQKEIYENRIKNLPNAGCDFELPKGAILRDASSSTGTEGYNYYRLKEPTMAKIQKRGNTNYENSRIATINGIDYLILGSSLYPADDVLDALGKMPPKQRK